MARPVIGLTGGMCSGKDTWAKDIFVGRLGFEWQGTSDITREYIAKEGLGEPTRDLVRMVSTELRRVHGASYLARTALERLDPGRPRIITGLYVMPEAEHVHAIGGNIVHVATDDELAFNRMSSRRRTGETGVWEEYRRLMDNDSIKGQGGTDQALNDVYRIADAQLDGSIPIADMERCYDAARNVLFELGIEL